MSNKNKMYLGTDMMMEIITNRELTVDGCKGVIEYDENYIKLNAKKGTVTIFGVDLEIKSYSEAALFIAGKIERIEFCM